MIIDDQHYDVIIIGTGAGGGTLAHQLAPSGKKILILERGTFLPQEEANWDANEVFRQERYHPQETWYDVAGEPFRPQVNYWVGGNTKVYGAALLRMRDRDFEAVPHQAGISPAWGLKYSDFEPYYAAAERLYQVHGQAGEDPTEPFRSGDYPYPAVSHEPRMQAICDAIAKQGLHPAHLPLSIQLDESDPQQSNCIRCNTCDGFPCKVQAKADAEVSALRPILALPHVTLLTDAKVNYLHTNPAGREIKGVEATVSGNTRLFMGDIVVVACGAINSAALLLRSANDQHPKGLANGSDQVGRNFMRHRITAVVQLSPVPNPSRFQKTICVNDFYHGMPDFPYEYPYPLGHIQNTGNILPPMIAAAAPPWISAISALIPDRNEQKIADRATGWWLQTEDLPTSTNRVRVDKDKIYLDHIPNNFEAHDRLVYYWTELLKEIDQSTQSTLIRRGIYPRSDTPVQVVANQCGTCRFGVDPQTSVLDLNCKTHEIDNLYVVDSSFFPSNAGVGPALTVMANALRVGDHLLERLG